LALALALNGELTEAHDLRLHVLDTFWQRFGEHDSNTATAMAHLADSLELERQDPDAERVWLARALAVHRRLYGEDDVRTLSLRYWLGDTLRRLGRIAEARDELEETVQRCRRVLGEAHRVSIQASINLVNVHLVESEGSTDRLQEVRLAAEAKVEASRRKYGEDDVGTLQAAATLANVCVWLDDLDRAKAMQVDILDRYRRLLGPEHQRTRHAEDQLSKTLGRLDV